MDNFEKLCEVLSHPRKNAVTIQFPEGSVVDDLWVVGYQYLDGQGVRCMCECLICHRLKSMTAGCLRDHKGTTHLACGQYEKTTDRAFHQRWLGMKQRIYNPNYRCAHRYAGRGLTCDYTVFADFRDDMYDSFIAHVNAFGLSETTLDRIDNDKGYVRGNLTWSTHMEQVHNSSKCIEARPFKAISPSGEILFGTNQCQFAREHPPLNDKQINAVLHGRFKSTLGWKFEFL